jgi:hypothetical protein
VGRRFLNGNEYEKEGEEIGTGDRDVKNPGFERVGDGDWRMTCEEFISRRQRGGGGISGACSPGIRYTKRVKQFFRIQKDNLMHYKYMVLINLMITLKLQTCYFYRCRAHK